MALAKEEKVIKRLFVLGGGIDIDMIDWSPRIQFTNLFRRHFLTIHFDIINRKFFPNRRWLLENESHLINRSWKEGELKQINLFLLC